MRTLLTVFFVLLCCGMAAETVENRMEKRHELRIGMGDPLAEYFADSPRIRWSESGRSAHIDPIYSAHIYLGYMYRINKWLSAGVEVDFQMTSWHYHMDPRVYRLVGIDREADLYLLPTVKFTYYHHPMVNLYSGISVGGVAFMGLDELYGSFAVNLNFLGVSVGCDHVFMAFELGYLATGYTPWGGRYGNISLGYRF